MRVSKTHAESIEKKKGDSRELAKILNQVPVERKNEVLWLVQGFAIGARSGEKRG